MPREIQEVRHHGETFRDLPGTELNTSIAMDGQQHVRCEHMRRVTLGRREPQQRGAPLREVNHTLRLTVVSNPYDFQQSAKADRWNGEKWIQIADLATGEIDVDTKLCYKPEAWNSRAFDTDIRELLRRVLLFL